MAVASSDGFQECKGVLRFRVPNGSDYVEAFLTTAACEAVHRKVSCTTSLADFYREHRSMLNEIVLRKLDAGARCPVVLMARDLETPP